MAQGVTIISRHKAPQHVLPFLHALTEILVGCDSVAREALQRMQTLSAAFEQQHKELMASSAPPEDDTGAAVCAADLVAWVWVGGGGCVCACRLHNAGPSS